MEWKSIDTAPQSEENILVFLGKAKHPIITIAYRPDHVNAPGSYRCAVDDNYFMKTPTHWMPLPEKPSRDSAES